MTLWWIWSQQGNPRGIYPPAPRKFLCYKLLVYFEQNQKRKNASCGLMMVMCLFPNWHQSSTLYSLPEMWNQTFSDLPVCGSSGNLVMKVHDWLSAWLVSCYIVTFSTQSRVNSLPLAVLSHKSTHPAKNNRGVEEFEHDNWLEKGSDSVVCHLSNCCMLTCLRRNLYNLCKGTKHTLGYYRLLQKQMSIKLFYLVS